MPPAKMKNFYNFNEVAQNILELFQMLLGEKSFFIAYTTPRSFSVLKTLDTQNKCRINEGTMLPLGDAFCQMVVRNQEPIIIDDATTHPVTKELTLTRKAKIRSYLGVPIMLQDGSMFGTLCAADSELCSFSESELQGALRLSNLLSATLDLESLAASFQLKSTALESTSNAVAITERNGEILWINPAYTKLTGYTLEELREHSLHLLDANACDLTTSQPIWQQISRGEAWKGELQNRRKDGSIYFEEMTITPVLDQQGQVAHFISMKQDITDRKVSEEQLNYLAHYDTLTDLPNRVMFRDHLSESITLAEDEEKMLALLFLDLDRFKSINDTLGHDIGDLLLQEAAKRIANCVRKQDIVSRISGDEFTVILSGIDNKYEVKRIAQQLSNAIAQPMVFDGYELFISTSIGISLYPADGSEPETLIKNADIAMVHAKGQGHDKVRFYTPNMNSASRLDLESYLRRALEKEEMMLHYQPKVDIRTGEMIGMEALLRWIHPVMGFVPPDVFIPIAEDIGMIGPIGEWVLRTACQQNKAWQDAGYPPLTMAVNLSVSQFNYSNIVEKVKSVLAETELEARWLELEITESIIIQNTEKVIETLLELKQIGIQISVDDFGTGYSSLRYLQMLPIDMLKIDRSFVRDIEKEDDEAAIPRAIISMAHSLNLRVIAEGVETREQLNCLRMHECDAMQGYLFSRPLPVEQFEKLLAERMTLNIVEC